MDELNGFPFIESDDVPHHGDVVLHDPRDVCFRCGKHPVVGDDGGFILCQDVAYLLRAAWHAGAVMWIDGKGWLDVHGRPVAYRE